MDARSFIPRGAASLSVDYGGLPRDYHFLLLPQLTLLAFASALKPLHVANQVSGKALYWWFLMTTDDQPVQCSCRVTITSDTMIVAFTRGA